MTCHAARFTSPDESHLVRIVAAGGGAYVGLQPQLGRAEPLVLFNAPNGTTLGVPLRDLNPDVVRARIRESEALTEERSKGTAVP